MFAVNLYVEGFLPLKTMNYSRQNISCLSVSAIPYSLIRIFMNNTDKKFAFEQTITLLAPLMTRGSESTPQHVFDKYFDEIYHQVISKMAEKEM